MWDSERLVFNIYAYNHFRFLKSCWLKGCFLKRFNFITLLQYFRWLSWPDLIRSTQSPARLTPERLTRPSSALWPRSARPSRRSAPTSGFWRTTRRLKNHLSQTRLVKHMKQIQNKNQIQMYLILCYKIINNIRFPLERWWRNCQSLVWKVVCSDLDRHSENCSKMTIQAHNNGCTISDFCTFAESF